MYIVSKCLLGYNCKYDGTNNENEKVIKFCQDKECLLVCPEVAGELGCPRPPAEQVWRDGYMGKGSFDDMKSDNFKVVTVNQKDVTSNYINGAKKEWDRAKGHEIQGAILKFRSPACGIGQIYDGTFTKTLTNGNGVFAQLLIDNGVPVRSEKDLMENPQKAKEQSSKE